MDFDQLDQQLRETFVDIQLDNNERYALRQLGAVLDRDRIRFMRNRAFTMVRELINHNPQDALLALKWLEQVIKTLDQALEQDPITASAQFTPGNACVNKIISLCKSTRIALDVCVFTISDNRLCDALIETHNRGIKLRIITDNAKQFDAGSDIERLRAANIPLRTDNNEYHMHHKFALFDGTILLNGSFNWTLSASQNNAENLLTTDNPSLVRQYSAQFEHLWQQYVPASS